MTQFEKNDEIGGQILPILDKNKRLYYHKVRFFVTVIQ